MPNNGETPTLLVCKGNDCFKKRKRAFDALVKTASKAGLDVDTIRCQGACSGPTAVVITTDGPRWFEELSGVKEQRDLCAFAVDGEPGPTPRLAKRELRGKHRAKASKRLAKQLAKST